MKPLPILFLLILGSTSFFFYLPQHPPHYQTNQSTSAIGSGESLTYLPVILSGYPAFQTLHSLAGDGIIVNDLCLTWEDCRNAVDGFAASDTTPEGVASNWNNLFGNSAIGLTRTYLLFDSTSLPPGVEILQIVLYIYGLEYQSASNMVHIVQSTATLPLGVEDFDQVIFESVGSTSPPISDWKSVVLDDTAVDWLVPGGFTQMALLHEYDLNDTPPDDWAEEWNFATIGLTENNGFEPYLVVIYAP